MRQRTLFDSEHDNAVHDMLERFSEQLRQVDSREEQALIREAMLGWEAMLGPALPNAPIPANQRASVRRMTA
ncbi:MAG: hypothetical protein JST38_18440 [Bacteroidetes bacterium]|nr:hypothetical protein [Bacteroidota bacterium]